MEGSEYFPTCGTSALTVSMLGKQCVCVLLWIGLFSFRVYNYRQISNIRRAKSQNLNVYRLVLQLSLPNPLKPDREWRCSWSSADRRCSNCIWVISKFIVTKVRLIQEVWRYFANLRLYIELLHCIYMYLPYSHILISHLVLSRLVSTRVVSSRLVLSHLISSHFKICTLFIATAASVTHWLKRTACADSPMTQVTHTSSQRILRRGDNTTLSILVKRLTIGTPYLWDIFVSTKIWYACVTVELHAITCLTGPCYNGTWLCVVKLTQCRWHFSKTFRIWDMAINPWTHYDTLLQVRPEVY